jgi:hypothetical protein
MLMGRAETVMETEGSTSSGQDAGTDMRAFDN